MDTKEAIEFFKKARGSYIYIRELDDKLFDEIIDLLEQGEKYRLMWGGIATMYKLPCYGLENSSGLDIVKHLEQKYFPKETNNYKEGEE